MEIRQKAYEQVPAGTHTGILYSLIDLGTQKMEYQGSVSFSPRIRFTWELPDELTNDFRPFSISKEFTLSGSSKSTLVKFLKAWLGEAPPPGFKIESLLGKACNLTVIHNQGKENNVYANVEAITPLKKGEQVKERHNPITFFEMTPPSSFKVDVFEKLPEFLQTKIRSSAEYIEAVNFMNGVVTEKPKVAISPDLNDEIPF